MDPEYMARLHSPTASSPSASTSTSSPAKRTHSTTYARFFPERGANFAGTFNLLSAPSDGTHSTYSTVLKNELLGLDTTPVLEQEMNLERPPGIGPGLSSVASSSSTAAATSSTTTTSTTAASSSSASSSASDPMSPSSTLRKRTFHYGTPADALRVADSPYSRTPISEASQQLLAKPRSSTRKIAKTAYKVLEAPAIMDDFYLHLVDWSSQNVLAVGLTNFVYLWNALTSQVTKLCSVGESNTIASVAWVQRGTHLAIGTHIGTVELWDVEHNKRVRLYNNHRARVGTMTWNTHLLTTGSRDRLIYHRDVRTKEQYSARLVGHRQEVCGLQWSPDGQTLASGGNDNHLLLWDARADTMLTRFTEHAAAVKAIAWSPHQRGVLASGGGTADRSIRFWNTLTNTPLCKIDTGSQVCNLSWSKNVNELVSTHGFSQNQIVVWSYPSMVPAATLTGHSMRVLYLAVSPDGTSIVTGAGDETLRFWNIFPPKHSRDGGSRTTSLLNSLEIR